MKIPTSDWFKPYMRAIGLVAAGMVIGGALFMSIYQHNFSILNDDNQRLMSENQEIRRELEPLIRKQNNKITVRQIRVHIQSIAGDNPLEEAIVSELRRALQRDLELLRGTTIDSVADSLIVAKGIIRRKIYRLPGDKEYTLDIPMIIVKNSELTIWAEARPYIHND
ncbi:MAG: hypothetical protein WDZ91_04535 [Paenibacillaceae bacterium]